MPEPQKRPTASGVTFKRVWVTPQRIIINSTTVELHWNPPEKPNGLISQNQLRRNGSLLLVGGSDEQNSLIKTWNPTADGMRKTSPITLSLDAEEESLLFVWLEGALKFTDDADTLQPSALCDYRIRAWNPEGVVDNLWSSVQTVEPPMKVSQHHGLKSPVLIRSCQTGQSPRPPMASSSHTM
ncbi:hypothetical protein ACRRTK_005179 [Alexandromys fortis]